MKINAKLMFVSSLNITTIGLMISFCSCKDKSIQPEEDKGFLAEAGPILFVSDKSGTQQLYSMNEDGSNIKQLTNDPEFPIIDAKWSPDGTKIAIVSSISDSLTYSLFNNIIFIVNANVADKYQLTPQWFDVIDSTYGNL